MTPGIIVFTYYMAISIYGLAPPDSAVQFSLTPVLAIVPCATLAFGLCFGSIAAVPYANRYGRKIVFIATIPFFSFCLIGAALVNSVPGLILLRFGAGLFAGPSFFLCFSVVSDLWISAPKSFPVALFVCISMFGAFVG